MKPVKVGFVGCGEHAMRSHIQIAAAMPNMFELCAFFDPNRDAAEAAADVQVSTVRAVADSLDDLLASFEVEAVVIASPPKFHLEAVSLAVEKGLHILCEKPLWDTLAQSTEGSALVERACSQGKVFTTCHPRRFEAAYVYAKENLSDICARLGRVTEFIYRFFYHKTSKAWRKEDSLLLDHMNHEIDLANFILGRQRTVLRAVSDGHDEYQVDGIRNDGARLTFSGSRRLDSRIYRNEMEVIFDKGRLTIISTLRDGTVYFSWVEDNFETGEQDRMSGSHTVEESFRGLMKNFALAVRGEAESYIEPEEAIANTVACLELLDCPRLTNVVHDVAK